MALNVKPAFQAEKITGKFKRVVTHIEEDVREVGALRDKKIIARKMVPIEEEFDTAYMIYFPQGHSILVAADDTDQLRRLGVLADPRNVDRESGEEVPEDYNLSPKEIVERRENNRPRPRGQVGGFTALDQGVIE
jgi:hypothetical protein